MDSVIFDTAEFRLMYPLVASFSDDQLNMYFSIAESLLDNTKCSLVKDLPERKTLLYMLTAHVATIYSNVQSGSPVVGRASSASEGSVSISLDYGTMGNSERWYFQTPMGAMYWQLTKKYRSALYRIGMMPMPVIRSYTR